MHPLFFSQRRDLLRVERVGFPLNYHDHQGALAASVVEDHDAPLVAEISGVHDEVHGCLWQRAFSLCSGFDEVATNRFDAASVLRGKLCGALLAFAVALPKGVGFKNVFIVFVAGLQRKPKLPFADWYSTYARSFSKAACSFPTRKSCVLLPIVSAIPQNGAIRFAWQSSPPHPSTSCTDEANALPV